MKNAARTDGILDPLMTCSQQVGTIFLDHDLERDSPLGLCMVWGFRPCRILQHINHNLIPRICQIRSLLYFYMNTFYYQQ